MQNPHRSAVLDTKPIHSALAGSKSMPSWLPDTNLSDLSLLEDDSCGIPIDNGYVLEGPARLLFVRFLGAGAFGYVFLAKNLDWVEPPLVSTEDVERSPLPESQLSHLEATCGAPVSSFSYSPPSIATESEGTSFSTLNAPFPAHPYYAVKCLDNNATTHEQRQREIQNHLVVQGHESIVKLYATIYEDGWTFLILEYVDGEDMRRSMVRQNIYATCDVRLGEVFGQVVDAVQYCHRKGVYHRDLKPENIMCRNGGLKVALGDFGLSTTTRMSSTFGCGSTFYMSPECAGQGYLAHGLPPGRWEPQPFDTAKNDVWCLGVVLFNMICGLTPWEKARESDVEFMHYLRHPLHLRQSLPISWRAFSLFLRIFDPNPETRITLDALEDELRNIDTFRMTPWEIEASTPGIRHAAKLGFLILPGYVHDGHATRPIQNIWIPLALVYFSLDSYSHLREFRERGYCTLP
ncbi:kinase domain protein [Rhizoctonia solani AG-3 Rhs1AP]|uniref:Kinase domain protein n=1 Tax=Rhizoctonia solani AG-3 Rhs1AP TaxID=1086054 RepID=X8JGT7_9AGAM|nr:kinase domain protein [Rhizoctonia solani AG-3 Rhs1AP]